MAEQLYERMRMEIGYRTDTGMQREVNEDSLSVANVSPALLHERGYLFVVADGVGGKAAGATASALATETMQKAYYSGVFVDAVANLSQSIHSANTAILSLGENPAYAGLASTVAAIVIHGNELVVGHVGDSRVYVIDSSTVRRLTEDHSWVVEQMRKGILTADEANQHSYRHVLVQSLGKADIVPAVQQFAIHPGSSLLLCSDGLHDLVTDAELAEQVRRHPPQVAADRLVELANQRGGKDNITVIIVQVDDGVNSGARVMSNVALADVVSRWESLPAQKQTLGIILVSILGCFILGGFVKLLWSDVLASDVESTPVHNPTATIVAPQATATPERKPTSTLAVTPTTNAEAMSATSAAPVSLPENSKVGVIIPHPTGGGDGIFLMPTPQNSPQAGRAWLPNSTRVVILAENIAGGEIYGDVFWHKVRVEVRGKMYEGYVPASIVKIEER